MQSENTSSEPLQLAPVIFSNLKEMVKIERAAHESVLGLSWKKMWPFNQFLAQVDFIRVMRVLSQIQEHVVTQIAFLEKERPSAPAEDLGFLELVPAYLDALAQGCVKLSLIAQYKQDVLEKKRGASIRDLNRLLLDYQHAQDAMVAAGVPLQKAWDSRPRPQA